MPVKRTIIKSFNKKNNEILLNGLGKYLLALNVICILGSITYIKLGAAHSVWNIFGILIIATLIGEEVLIYLNGLFIYNVNKHKQLMSLLGYMYLITVIVAMFNMLIGNYTLSNSYSSSIDENINLYYTIYFSYFIIFVLGCAISYLNTLDLDYRENFNEVINKKNIIRGFFKVICYLALCIGVIVAYVVLSENYTMNLEIFTTQFAVFYGFIFLSITIIILMLKNNKRGFSYYLVTFIGIGVFFICIFPLVLTPYTIVKAEKSFDELYGSAWKSKIDRKAKEYFLNTQFSIPAYFLGIESNNYIVKKDILFYNGKDSNGKEVKLHFDAYTPKNYNKDLPGKDSTVIRIHGGAWVAGDKGELNVLQMNKYLAGQGYKVFDIQYGLSNNSYFTTNLGEPEYVRGKFDIDDMIRHIGIFTKYLEKHSKEYNANLDSVFISGGSAGGHLAAATGLAIDTGQYKNIFSDKIKVKGLILYYPANGLPKLGGINGNNKFLEPQLLIQKNSPPCIIYQGTKDGLVPKKVSKLFRDTYLGKGNRNCTILWMSLGSHGSDFYFSGNYNQVFLYYMERFMYINK